MNNSYYVYIVSCGEFMKVGLARVVDRRLSALSAANPLGLSLIGCFEFPSRIAAAVAERAAHNSLKKIGAHKKLEWFWMNQKSLDCALNSLEYMKSGKSEELYRRLLDLKQLAKKREGITLASIAEYMDANGYSEEAKIIKNSHAGPHCSIRVTEDGIKALSDYLEPAK